jgi:hypothetical protein
MTVTPLLPTVTEVTLRPSGLIICRGEGVAIGSPGRRKNAESGSPVANESVDGISPADIVIMMAKNFYLSPVEMAKPELIGAKTDERLEYLLTSVKEGVRIFANAIRNSPDDTDTVAFRAFTLKSKSKEEIAALFDLVMTSVALELHEQAKELVEKFTFYHKVEEQDEEHSSLFWYCRKVAPPTKEEVEKMVADDMTVASEALPLLSVEEAVVETKA